MIYLKKLTDKELILSTKKLTKKEDEVFILVIAHLEEIEARRLYADFHCESLWSYCIRELGYSEPQAWRRIDAMRISKKIPEVKQGLASGELKISTVNMASQFLRSAPGCNGAELIKEIT